MASFNVVMERYGRERFIDVYAGFDGPRTTGSVQKVIRRGSATVGLKSDGSPVYVLIRNAEKVDATFHKAAEAIFAGREPNASIRKHVLAYCREKMRELCLAYQAKQLEKALKTDSVTFAFE